MTSQSRGFEILLVEDNPADAGLVRQALDEHRLEYTLHIISDGEQAIKFLNMLDRNANAPQLDLLVLDMHLPKRNGEEILKRLRSTERYAQTPVIVMTGGDSRSLEEKAIKHAAISFFRKPSRLYEFMQLGSIIENVLRTRTAGPGGGLGSRKNAAGGI